MAKSQLIIAQHEITPGEECVEVWWNGQMIATVYGADGPGVKIISKHPSVTLAETKLPGTTEVRFAL